MVCEVDALPEGEPRAEESGVVLSGRATRWTVRSWGEAWLRMREQSGLRAVEDDRGRWRTHVACEAWFERPIGEVTRADARAWLAGMYAKQGQTPGWKRRRTIRPQTIKNALNLLRRAFEDAAEDGVLETNVWAGLRVRKGARVVDTWTVLRPDEQGRALEILPMPERLIAQFAMGSLMRRGELFALKLEDWHIDDDDPHVIARFTQKKKRRGQKKAAVGPTKSGKPRRVPIFGMALEAAEAWILQLKSFAPENPLGLVFPLPNGELRKQPFASWKRVSETFR